MGALHALSEAEALERGNASGITSIRLKNLLLKTESRAVLILHTLAIYQHYRHIW